MYDADSNLFPIAFDYLYEGMEVRDEIYNYTGKVVLLGKGNVLDDKKIERLKRFNSDKNNIYVLPSTRKQLLDKKFKRTEIEQKAFEQEMGYTEVSTSAEGFLLDVRYTQKVRHDRADFIETQLHEMVEEIELIDMLNLINAPRPLEEYTQRHCINVGILNGLIGKWLDLPKHQISELIMVGILHDVGKTKIPQEILEAPRKLTDDEYEIVKRHPQYSHELLMPGHLFSEKIMMGVRHHHERVDGTGYPDRLSGDEISKYAKITAISDVYDAMVAKRSYKQSCSPIDVLTQFSQNEFEGFDEKYLTAFLQKMPAQFINKQVLLENGDIGVIKYIMPNDIAHPIIVVNGIAMQTTDDNKCTQVLSDIVDDAAQQLGVLRIPD